MTDAHRPLKHSTYYFLPLALIASAPAAWADTAAQNTQSIPTGMMLQTTLALVTVLASVFLAAYCLSKFNASRGIGKPGTMRIVSGLMIGNREKIVLLEIGDVWLVVGVSPGQIRTLHTMPKGEIANSATDDKSFGQWLRQTIEQKNEAK